MHISISTRCISRFLLGGAGCIYHEKALNSKIIINGRAQNHFLRRHRPRKKRINLQKLTIIKTISFDFLILFLDAPTGQKCLKFLW